MLKLNRTNTYIGKDGFDHVEPEPVQPTVEETPKEPQTWFTEMSKYTLLFGMLIIITYSMFLFWEFSELQVPENISLIRGCLMGSPDISLRRFCSET